jgi:lipid-binding SYLF domain-containing protein
MNAVRLAAVAALAFVMAACSTAPKSAEGRQNLRSDARAALDRMTSRDPTLRDFLDRAHGYAVFPTVGKGGAGVGGAYGRGIVYEQGQPVGYADLTQASAGAQLGGQSYSEVIVFENADALGRLKGGTYSVGAGVSAVLLKSGVAREVRFKDGVAVFTHPKKGAMAEATVSGQKVNYKPMTGAEAAG